MRVSLRSVLPNHPVPMRILRGPFRGARIMMNPRCSLRKAFGLYEHENNAWLESALRRISRVLDVGANDGYFTFGCAAAFRRLGVRGEIIGFEPQTQHVKVLQESMEIQPSPNVPIEIVQRLVGDEDTERMTTLDALPANDRRNTLIKIDVEGAEVDVIAGAQSWMNASNLFIIEVHKSEYFAPLQEMFSRRGLKLRRVNQQPLPLLGREERDENNWWLLSELQNG